LYVARKGFIPVCDLSAGLMREGPAGTLLRGPTATEGPETEGTFGCLLLTNSE